MRPNALAVAPEGLWSGQQNLDAEVAERFHKPVPTDRNEAAWLVDWNGKLLKTVMTESRNISDMAYGDGCVWMVAIPTPKGFIRRIWTPDSSAICRFPSDLRLQATAAGATERSGTKANFGSWRTSCAGICAWIPQTGPRSLHFAKNRPQSTSIACTHYVKGAACKTALPEGVPGLLIYRKVGWGTSSALYLITSNRPAIHISYFANFSRA